MLARAAAPLLLALALVGCGGSGNKTESTPSGTSDAASAKEIKRNPANASTTLTIASKDFTEEFILGEIYAQALAAGGYKVRKRLDIGSEKVAFAAVKAGEVDAYPEYTGTALTTFFGVPTDKIPKDEQEAYDQAKASFAKAHVTALPPTPFTDSNAVGMTQVRAQELGIQTISDLKSKASRLTLSGSKECRTRLDCKLGLEQTYGLKFKRFLPTALSERHSVLTRGRADVSIVFSTDGQIASDDLLVLEDDRKLFPPYNVSLIVNDKAAEAAGPDLPRIVAQVQQDLSTKVMQELNSRVDLDKEKPAAVARAYLEQFGYVTPAAG
ncbi:MAG: glycine betaine ABC transporter substrate-binding protein [Solirubrobacteraceae bacterium]